MEPTLAELPILQAKITPPPVRPQAVPRPRLVARLNEAAARPLTLISAPAGFGKTTLASHWLADIRGGQGVKAAWLSLDADDNDVARFLMYCIAALQSVEPALGQRATALIHSAAPKTIITMLLNDGFSLTPGTRILLVLDDYHAINSPAVHDLVEFFIEQLPPGLRLVLTTRDDPPLPLARYRVSQQLAEIRAEDLRFTPDETAAFMLKVMGLNLPADEVLALGQHAEGWIAGLQLAALALQGGGDIPGLLAAFNGGQRHVLDYFSQEVLGNQPAPVANFLQATCVLERLTAPLCAAVLGGGEWSPERCQATLERLDQANLFLVPLDNSRQWYRYHHLFAEALRAQLRAAQPGRLPGLHGRASAWYESQNEMDGAIRHALSARAFTRAADLIETRTRWWVRNEVSLLARWLAALPEDVIRERPRLWFNRVWELLANERTAEAEEWLNRLGPTLDTPTPAGAAPGDGHLKAEVLVLRSAAARQRRQMGEAVRYGRAALALAPVISSDLRAVAALHLGNALLLQGELDAANQTLAQAREAALAAQHASVYVSAGHSLATISLSRGQLREAEASCLQSIRYAQQQPQPVLTGLESIGLVEVYREWNDFPKAEAALADGLALAEQGGSAVQIRLGYLAGARLKQSQGEWARAAAYLDQAAQLTQERDSWNADVIAASRARLAVASGHLAEALRWARQIPSQLDELAFVWDIQQAALARVGLANGNPQAAKRTLCEWRAAAQRGRRAGRVLEADALFAVWHWKHGRGQEGLTLMGEVLETGAQEGYVRLFIEEGQPMLGLLEAFGRRCPPALVAYVQQLLAAFTPRVDANSNLLVTALSEREVDVLRLLAEGRSYNEIAVTLVLALSTVQSYIRTLYRKLDVHSGREAVARARELRLIP